MNLTLFDDIEQTGTRPEWLGACAVVLRGFALPYMPDLIPALEKIRQAAPFRNMVTPGGFRMSVALTNCGSLGWTTDRHGYKYTTIDPDSGRPWPDLPPAFLQLAQAAAAQAGFADFAPDACLINQYLPGAKMSLHQDKNEHDFDAPVVSVSLGLPAMFQFGGNERSDRAVRVPLLHGDVVVWGGPDRLRYHGILPLKEGYHPLIGEQRINFTLRKAG